MSMLLLPIRIYPCAPGMTLVLLVFDVGTATYRRDNVLGLAGDPAHGVKEALIGIGDSASGLKQKCAVA